MCVAAYVDYIICVDQCLIKRSVLHGTVFIKVYEKYYFDFFMSKIYDEVDNVSMENLLGMSVNVCIQKVSRVVGIHCLWSSYFSCARIIF